MTPSGLYSQAQHDTESASSNWSGACAGVSTNLAALEVTVDVSAALGMPAGVPAPQLTGHTTGIADGAGVISESDLMIVAVPGVYILSFTLTDFPLV